MNESTYISREDSELLRKGLGSYRGSTCLEVGIGYGSNLLDLQKNFQTVVGTDLYHTEPFAKVEQEFMLVVSDGGSPFRDDIFDLVAINPPYLPSEKIEDPAVDGGKGGFEVIRKFLLEATRITKADGVILLVISSETSFGEFENFCQQNSLIFAPIITEPLFFEKLVLYEIKRVITYDLRQKGQ